MGQPQYILLYIFYTSLFVWLIFKWRFFTITEVNKRHLVFFFLLKVIAGLGLTLIYTYYYTDPDKADIYRYFNDSKIISSILFTNPLAWLKIMSGFGIFEPATFAYLHNTWHFTHPSGDLITSNSFLIRIVSLFNYLSGYNIYIDTLLLNCITFTSLVLLFKALKPCFSEFAQILYWPLFLMPSFVFWSSGLLKEGFIFVGLSLYLSAWLNVKDKRSPINIAIVFLGLVIVLLTKIYVAAVLVICSLSLPMKLSMDNKLIWLTRLTFWLLIVVGLWYGLSNGFCERVIDKRNEFIMLSVAEHSGSAIDTAIVAGDCGHLAGLVPAVMTNAILRPFIWEKGNLFEMLFGVENLAFILALLALLAFYFKKPEGDKRLLMLFCLFFSLLNYLSIGITVPILGAIVHYRIVAAPFLLLSVLLMIDLGKLKKRLSSLVSLSNYKS